MKRIYRMTDYYRTDIHMDTARDSAHLVSVMKSFMPELSVSTSDKVVYLDNVRNHMGQKIKITFEHQI